MKKLLLLVVLLVSIFTLTSVFTEAASPTFDVTVNARFDNSNIDVGGTDVLTQTYGTKVTLDSNLPSDPGGDTYTFAFWIVNGVARYDLAQNHEFIITGDMDIEAVYSKSTEHAAIFMDTNGKVLDTQYVTDGGDAQAPSPGSSYTETFDNSNATGSYSDRSFTGENDITWTYVESRDGNGDANSSGIDLPALMLRRSSDNSKITSSVISGGISSFEVKLYKGFTGGGDRQVELFINGVSYGTSIAFDDYDEHIFRVENIDVEGDFTVEIRNITSKQVIIDDIQIDTQGTVLPSKPGLIVDQLNTWNAPLTNITEDQVFILQYEVDS
ncbi:MAG: hypothetical protein ACOCU1_02990, partial [Bacillota bacterium]